MTIKKVRNIQTITRSRLVTISVDTPLLIAARTLSDTHISLVVVCDADGVMAGVITKTDLVKKIGHCLGSACQTLAAELMVSDVASCSPGDLLSDVLSMMEKRGFVHFPVVDADRRPLGVVNARDALRVLIADEQYEESLLRDYVMGVGYH